MIPYRFRHSFRKCVTVLLWTAVICVAFLLCWLLWLNRYVIYTRNGARLDFSQAGPNSNGEVAVAPTEDTLVNIYFDDGTQTPQEDPAELQQLSGIYVTADMLTAKNFDATAAALKALDTGSTIMLDVKSIHGRFYYSTDLGPASDGIPVQEFSQLIAQLSRSGHYLIARLPALRDYYYALDHVSNGIYLASKRGLWLDSDRTYWLNPAKEDVLTYLRDIVTELRVMGFSEVVLDAFTIPDTKEVFYDGDRTEAIQKAAEALTKLSTDTFAVSFMVSDPTFSLPAGRTRLYFAEVPAASAAATVAATGIADADTRIVFLTDLMDTRFDPYGVLRPLRLDS